MIDLLIRMLSVEKNIFRNQQLLSQSMRTEFPIEKHGFTNKGKIHEPTSFSLVSLSLLLSQHLPYASHHSMLL